jgi:hypothetical protein
MLTLRVCALPHEAEQQAMESSMMPSVGWQIIPPLFLRMVMPLAACVLLLAAAGLGTTVARAESGVAVNGIALSEEDLAALTQTYGPIQPGRYWYDSVSGYVGLEGGPSVAQIHPGLPLGGPLRADASGGGTDVFINGREIHVSELDYLIGIFGSVEPGRYWLGANGIGGVEGGPAAFDLNAAAGSGGGGSTINSRDGQSSLSTGSDGCSYFSSGDISASTC